MYSESATRVRFRFSFDTNPNFVAVAPLNQRASARPVAVVGVGGEKISRHNFMRGVCVLGSASGLLDNEPARVGRSMSKDYHPAGAAHDAGKDM